MTRKATTRDEVAELARDWYEARLWNWLTVWETGVTGTKELLRDREALEQWDFLADVLGEGEARKVKAAAEDVVRQQCGPKLWAAFVNGDDRATFRFERPGWIRRAWWRLRAWFNQRFVPLPF